MFVRLCVRLLAFALLLAGGWLTVVVFPTPLFAHVEERANVVLHAREPLPPEAGPILDDVVQRLARSPLYDPANTHHVFLCDTPAVFAFFTPWASQVGGAAHFSGNAFIRPSNVARNRVVGSSGEEKNGERTLAYYIAHEVTHAMTLEHLGLLNYQRLPAFQTEGYADYVAFARPVDLAAGREAMRRNERDMDVRRSGLYKRYELLVAYLLERRGLGVDNLLERPLDRAEVERQLEADPTLPTPR